MKTMSKSIIISKNLRDNIIREKTILSSIKSNLITNIICSFQDFSKLYLVLELMKGGNLRYHLNHFQGHFPEKMVKFIIINISLCLALIQDNDIVHRDIKPENFLFDEKGYLHITDFNSAVYRKEENIKNDFIIKNKIDSSKIDINQINLEKKLIGTYPYIAPENILATQNHISFSEDYFSFGVICYEMIFRRKPFIEKTRALLGKEMLKDKINFSTNFNYSEKLINFVKKLLKINPKDRLGTNKGFIDIKKSEYLSGFNWDKFMKRKYNSPFVEVIEDYKKYYLKSEEDDIELFDFVNSGKKTFDLTDEEISQLHKIEGDPFFLDYFNGYEYNFFKDDDYASFIKSISDKDKAKNKKKKLNKSNSYNNMYSKHHSVDNSSYFENRKNNKSVVYLPIVKKEKKIVIPDIYPKILSDAYKYKIYKYQKLLNQLNRNENTKNNLNYRGPIPLIINNYHQPNGENNFINPLYHHAKNNSSHIKNNIFFPYINHQYSSLSSSATYELLGNIKQHK